MANRHIDEARNLNSELARQYMWEVHIPQLPAGLPSTRGLSQFTFRAISTTVPDNVTEMYERMYKSAKIAYGGKDASGKTFDITFIDGEDLFVYQAFFNWINIIKTADKDDYARPVVMNLLKRDDSVALVVKLIDAWPENLQAVTLDYASNEPLNVPVTFKYDDIEISSR